MILIDTGPLVALCNRNDSYHALCTETSNHFRSQVLISTWPCVTEAMYFLGKTRGAAGQQPLWDMLFARDLDLIELDLVQLRFAHSLMQKYQDFPMSFADATLLVAASSLGIESIFTLDRGFRVFRLPNGSILDVIPNEIL